MRSLLTIGFVIGAGFVLLGYFARSPGQEALSNAVIGLGAAAVLFVIVLAGINYLSTRRDR